MIISLVFSDFILRRIIVLFPPIWLIKVLKIMTTQCCQAWAYSCLVDTNKWHFKRNFCIIFHSSKCVCLWLLIQQSCQLERAWQGTHLSPGPLIRSAEWGGVLSDGRQWLSKLHPGGGWSLSRRWGAQPSLGDFWEFRKRTGGNLPSNAQGGVNTNEPSKHRDTQSQINATQKPGCFHNVESTSIWLFGVMELKYLNYQLNFSPYWWMCHSQGHWRFISSSKSQRKQG